MPKQKQSLVQKEIEFKTHFSEPLPLGEKFNLPSQTVPDASLTIPQMIDRYVKGLPLMGNKLPQFNESDLPDFNKMDLTELAEYGEQLANRIKEGRDRAMKARDEAAKLKQQSLFDDAVKTAVEKELLNRKQPAAVSSQTVQKGAADE